jgi:DNA-binding transcriptional MerR regulator
MPRRTSKRQAVAAGGLLSIGALSAATGIAVETIRTWERRYGFPVADRKPSGHRVYPLATVPRLRRVAEAIARGHRAAEVVAASESTLEALLASLPHVPQRPVRPGRAGPPVGVAATGVADLLDAVRTFDAERLRQGLEADWARLGPIEFLERRTAPLLRAMGDSWAAGTLDVRHEHFGSAVLGDFLRAMRLAHDGRATDPIAALATLPGELHGLGLQMSALVLELAGWRTLMLGVNTPVAQIAALGRDAPIAAVAVSCVLTRRRGGALPVLQLRRSLSRRIPLIVGGAGAPASARGRGIEIIPDLAALERWARIRHAGPAGTSGP